MDGAEGSRGWPVGSSLVTILWQRLYDLYERLHGPDGGGIALNGHVQLKAVILAAEERFLVLVLAHVLQQRRAWSACYSVVRHAKHVEPESGRYWLRHSTGQALGVGKWYVLALFLVQYIHLRHLDTCSLIYMDPPAVLCTQRPRALKALCEPNFIMHMKMTTYMQLAGKFHIS